MKTSIRERRDSIMKNKKDLLRLGLVGLGAIFLFNPTINIVDILPDFIGYWLIALGLTAMAYMSGHLSSARKSFVYLAFITAGKAAVCLAIPKATDTFTVLMAFSFAVAEAVLFIPAVSALFEGMSSLSLRLGNDDVFYVPLTKSKAKKAKKQGKSYPRKTMGSLKTLTVIAFIIRAVGSIVPTLPSLMLYGDTLFVTSGKIDWSDYVGVFYILAWITGFAVGIPWLSSFMRYWKGVAANEAFCAALCNKYESEVLSDKGRLASDRMKKVMIISVVMAVSTIYLPIDYVNAIPGFVTAGLAVAAFVYLLPSARKSSVFGIISAFVWSVVSALSIWLQTDYRANNYDPGAAVAFGGEGRGIAKELYFRMEIVSYVEALLFVVTMLIFVYTFMKVLSKDIAMMPPRRDGLARDVDDMKKCLIPVGISGGIVLAFSFGITFVTKYFTGVWLINMIAVATLSVFTLLAYFKLDDKVYLPLRRKY